MCGGKGVERHVLFFCSYTNDERFERRQKAKALALSAPETKTAEFANSVDLDEVAPNEPSHLDLHSLPSSL